MLIRMNTPVPSGHLVFEMSSLPTMTLDASPMSVTSPAGEESVIASLLSGQLSAVGELYDRHHEAVRRFAQRLLGDASEAEDLVQEVFVRLPRIAKSYRGESSFRSFLIGATAQLSRHHIRASQRRRALHERSGAAGMVQLPEAERPDVQSERHRLAKLLTQALDQLSFDHRVAFVLSEVEQHTSREIAVLVGVPEGTVRTRLLHAKKRLRTYLEKEGLP